MRWHFLSYFDNEVIEVEFDYFSCLLFSEDFSFSLWPVDGSMAFLDLTHISLELLNVWSWFTFALAGGGILSCFIQSYRWGEWKIKTLPVLPSTTLDCHRYPHPLRVDLCVSVWVSTGAIRWWGSRFWLSPGQWAVCSLIDSPQMAEKGWLAWLLCSGGVECLPEWIGVWAICEHELNFHFLPVAGDCCLNAGRVQGYVFECCLCFCPRGLSDPLITSFSLPFPPHSPTNHLLEGRDRLCPITYLLNLFVLPLWGRDFYVLHIWFFPSWAHAQDDKPFQPLL